LGGWVLVSLVASCATDEKEWRRALAPLLQAFVAARDWPAPGHTNRGQQQQQQQQQQQEPADAVAAAAAADAAACSVCEQCAPLLADRG